MSLVLLVGNATLDIINSVGHYPHEDEEVRATTQRIVPGGNAANSAVVLAQLGHRCRLLATMADDRAADQIQHALMAVGVEIDYLQRIAGAVSPVSYITLNQRNGSRTIVHYRDLAELDSPHLLTTVDYTVHDWLHFEGRNNVPVLAEVLPRVREQCFDQVLSLEIEKPRLEIEQLIQHVDLVMFSQSYAMAKGYESAAGLLQAMHQAYPEQMFSCTWGHEGAWAIGGEGKLYHAQQQVAEVVDTVGAGDAFNAGLISALASGQTLPLALAAAVELAARKVARVGFTDLGNP